MSELQLRQLSIACHPLLNKFYRAHGTHMRVPARARCWVAGHPDIVAGLCLSPVDDGHWLTGLLVAPSRRDQGLAKRLVTRVLAECGGPVWLFCEPKLMAFYQHLGFSEATTLPEALASRLHRYNRNKTLMALWHDNERDRMTSTVLKIATACLLDDSGRVLVVRKRGTRLFMLPGGKIEPGEIPLQALKRELREELDLAIEASQLRSLGHFQARAANEPDHWVQADVFVGRLVDKVRVQAEIEALDWLELQAQQQEHLAPLLREQVLPALIQRLAEERN
ncbi:GNAT family N-acetyltransferase [Pseudomonas sp. KSR10]|uniref:GNAT family N-acetyltransferase n=1 Tax=Pseudomonas sp. KSR10 TaxID=2916654 RepID=UPI001EF7E043|nr:GNAT family N-acetyltransferase [Pseudomonas sp. KSR10]MCG6540243.1 GNAT family N-acetyltransferase [Pseudomonas sp. KSR10]